MAFVITNHLADLTPGPGSTTHWGSYTLGNLTWLIVDRGTTSATELVTRLACPLRWVLSYPARLRPGAAGRLPTDFALKGTFGHAVLAEVFQRPILPGAEQAADLAVEIFERRVARDAAPLPRD